MYEHVRIANHWVDNSNFKNLARGYNKNKERKIAEVLFIRDLQPYLNSKLRVINWNCSPSSCMHLNKVLVMNYQNNCIKT